MKSSIGLVVETKKKKKKIQMRARNSIASFSERLNWILVFLSLIFYDH